MREAHYGTEGKDLTGNRKRDHEGEKKSKKESHKRNDLLIKTKMSSIARAEIERNAFSNTPASLYPLRLHYN